MQLTHIYEIEYAREGRAVYSTGAFDVHSWSRYLRHFDTLRVVGPERAVAPHELARHNRVDRERVSFRFTRAQKDLGAIARGLVPHNPELEAIVRESDALAVRLYSEISCQAAAFALRHDVPLAVEVVDCPWDALWNHGSLAGRVLAPYARQRLRRLVARAPHVLYVTEHFLQGRYQTRGVAAHASNVQLADSPERAPAARDPGGPTPLRIGLIGNYDVALKGHSVALEALAALGEHTPPIELHLVGDGDPASLAARAEALGLNVGTGADEGTGKSPGTSAAGTNARVRFTGKLPAGAAVRALLDTLDVYVHPSRKEGLPRSVVEAMNRGLPVLASSVGGTPELLHAPFLHRPGDSAALAGQLRRLLPDTAGRAAAGARNLERSRAYEPAALEAARDAFWGGFAAYCRERRGESSTG